MKTRRIVWTVLLVALLGTVPAVGPVLAKTYKTGLSLALTGPTADAGVPYAMGVEDFFRYANEEKLLGDDTIDCTIKDDQYKTDITKRNFEEFLDMDIPIYLNYSTGSTLGLKRDFEEERMPTIPASFHAGNLVESNYIFLPIASYSEQCVGLAEYVANNHKGDKPKIAMFLHPSAFGRAPLADVEKAIAAGLNAELVEVVEHGKDLDNTATLKRLVENKVQYVISQTVQSTMATFIKDARRLGLIASRFGEEGKITFMGAHYTGGNDLIALAGEAAENFYWTTAYRVMSEPGAGTDFQMALAKRYDRDEKTANSHNYTNGIMVAQLAVEAIRRAKEAGEVTNESVYAALNGMNGDNAFVPGTTVGPVTYSETDRAGVDMLQLYRAKDGVFVAEGEPFSSAYMKKIK